MPEKPYLTPENEAAADHARQVTEMPKTTPEYIREWLSTLGGPATEATVDFPSQSSTERQPSASGLTTPAAGVPSSRQGGVIIPRERTAEGTAAPVEAETAVGSPADQADDSGHPVAGDLPDNDNQSQTAGSEQGLSGESNDTSTNYQGRHRRRESLGQGIPAAGETEDSSNYAGRHRLSQAGEPLGKPDELENASDGYRGRHRRQSVDDAQAAVRSLSTDEEGAKIEYRLAEALNEYAELVAARERSTIPSPFSLDDIKYAREKYEGVRREANRYVDDKLKLSGMSAEERMAVARLEDLSEAKAIATAIAYVAERRSAPRGPFKARQARFYNWWARQGADSSEQSRKKGRRGAIEKSAAMAVVGFPVGLVAGTAGAFLVGPLAGGAVAGGAAAVVARSVSRGLLRAHIEKNAAASPSVAAAKSEYRLNQQLRSIDRAYSRAEIPEDVTGVFAAGTERDLHRNRRRLIGSLMVGAVSGLVGGAVGAVAHNVLWSGGGTSTAHIGQSPGRGGTSTNPVSPPAETPQPTPSSPTSPPSAPPESPDIHDGTGEAFSVEAGSGVIKEIGQYAAAHHYTITPRQAFEVYQSLHGQFGRNIIDLAGNGPDTYLDDSEVRLSRIAAAHWGKGVETVLRQHLETVSRSNG